VIRIPSRLYMDPVAVEGEGPRRHVDRRIASLRHERTCRLCVDAQLIMADARLHPLVVSDDVLWIVETANAPVTPSKLRWHAFLSHAQATAGDQCLVLREALLGRGAEAWLDCDYNTSAESMREGAMRSALFVLFLSRSVLARPFCQMEIKAAMRSGKKMAFVLDDDPTCGGAPLEELIAEGRAFSANAAQAAAGKVHLAPADFDALFPGGYPAHPVVHFRRGAALHESTVPMLFALISGRRFRPASVHPAAHRA